MDFIAGWKKDTGEHFLLCLEHFLRPEARVLKPRVGVMGRNDGRQWQTSLNYPSVPDIQGERMHARECSLF